jgi:hypothetical protein
MSRIPDRRAALTHGFHLTCRGTASAVGLQWPITMLQPRDGRAKAAGCVSIQVTLAGPRPLPSAGPGMARLASLGADRVHEKEHHPCSSSVTSSCSEGHGPIDLVRNGNRHMKRRAPPSEMAGLSCF